ncbi:MAG: ribose-phosphate pyrophosphokinase [Acidobacteriota bacterium]|nr:MAG: ribose-phosphate pyrophosphokinase [Acidobacteriota bacterium]
MTTLGPLKVFGGTAHPDLVRDICVYLGMEPGAVEVERFSDGEVYVQVLENVRGADVFVIQPTLPPAENILELLLLLDAFKRSSAARVTAVIPYYGYARQERKDKPRVPISARLIADLIQAANADRVLTMDLHAPAIQGFFSVPVDHLYAAPLMIDHIRRLELENLTIVSPDAGGVERARFFSGRLGCGLAIVDKRRTAPNVARSVHVIGNVEDRNCVIVDDIIDTGGTLLSSSTALMEAGARSVRGCFTHAVLSGKAMENLSRAPLANITVTNTIPLDDGRLSSGMIDVLSTASLLGEAIKRTHTHSSISSLFV